MFLHLGLEFCFAFNIYQRSSLLKPRNCGRYDYKAFLFATVFALTMTLILSLLGAFGRTGVRCGLAPSIEHEKAVGWAVVVLVLPCLLSMSFFYFRSTITVYQAMIEQTYLASHRDNLPLQSFHFAGELEEVKPSQDMSLHSMATSTKDDAHTEHRASSITSRQSLHLYANPISSPRPSSLDIRPATQQEPTLHQIIDSHDEDTASSEDDQDAYITLDSILSRKLSKGHSLKLRKGHTAKVLDTESTTSYYQTDVTHVPSPTYPSQTEPRVTMHPESPNSRGENVVDIVNNTSHGSLTMTRPSMNRLETYGTQETNTSKAPFSWISIIRVNRYYFASLIMWLPVSISTIMYLFESATTASFTAGGLSVDLCGLWMSAVFLFNEICVRYESGR